MNTGPETIREQPRTEKKRETKKLPDALAETVPMRTPDVILEAVHSDMIADIAEARAETMIRFDSINSDVPTPSEGLVRFRDETIKMLDANGAAMEMEAEMARRESRALLALDESELNGPKTERSVSSEDVLAAISEQGPESSYDQKLEVLLPALEANPQLGATLNDLDLSSGEKLGVVLRLAKKSPNAFFTALETSGISLTRDEKMALSKDILEDDPLNFPEAAKRFNMAHDDVTEVIAEYSPENREVLLGVLKIPVREGTTPLPEGAEKGEKQLENKEISEKVEAVRGASRELMLAIETAFPERVEAERQRAKIERELMGKIESYGELFSSAAEQTAAKPIYLHFEGRPLPAINKPKSREEVIRPGIKEGEAVGREVLATFVDRALKLDIVPPTVLRDGPEGIGSVQDWQVGTVAHKLGNEAYSQKHEAELKKLAFFDWLTDNSDRHGGNWLVSPDGKHQAIDNGAIFGKRLTLFDRLKSVPSAKMAGKDLPPEIRKNVEELMRSPEVLASLKKGFEATLSEEDAPIVWEGFIAKLELVRNTPDFKIQDTEW